MAGVFGVAGSFLAFFADFGCSSLSLVLDGDSWIVAAPRLRFEPAGVAGVDGSAEAAAAALLPRRPVAVVGVALSPSTFDRS